MKTSGGLEVDFEKYADGLAPAIVQDGATGKVLMLGFMNRDALERTQAEGKVTFFSRSRKALWTKGEESGNLLLVKGIADQSGAAGACLSYRCGYLLE